MILGSVKKKYDHVDFCCIIKHINGLDESVNFRFERKEGRRVLLMSSFGVVFE